MAEKHHILVVDDDAGIIASLRLLLKTEGYQVTTATTPQEAVFFIKNNTFDIVLMDLNYSLDTTSGAEGLSLIEDIKKLDDNLPIVVMTGWATIDVAVQTIKTGAGDFVQKPWENERLLSILSNQIKLSQSRHIQDKLSEENQLLKQALDAQVDNDLIAESPAMKQLLATIEQVAKTDINILITGENGTGKSLMAKYIHNQASKDDASDAFVSVNMGAISESLFESEMFGHVKGAFTDAKTARIGRFELANNGTLFLDEIGNIPLSQQAKLLRVIEEQQFEKVGSSKTQHINVRVISATNANLTDMVNDKTFRMDLLYRLNTLELKLPPLRQRTEDILELANRMLAKFCDKYQKPQATISNDALAALKSYHWPGNIRELSHLLERVVLLNQSTTIEAAQLMLPDSINNANNNQTIQNHAKQQTNHNNTINTQRTMEDIEIQVIKQRLNEHQGNAVDAAKSLGLSRSAFYRRLEKYNIWYHIKTMKKLSFEAKLLFMILLCSVPSGIGLIVFMLIAGVSVYLTAMIGIILFIVIAWCAAAATHKTNYLFLTLSNLLEAMTHGDYSLKGRKESTDSALDNLVSQINLLSDTLARQKLEVKQHQLLVNKIINHIDVAIIALDSQDQITLANPQAKKLMGPNKTIDIQALEQNGKYNIVQDSFIENGSKNRLWFITDVRDLLRAEERKTWQNLIRVLSHEINNSLTPISSISQTLNRLITQAQDGKSDNISDNIEDIQDGLTLIHQRANSLKTFIDSYRNLSRLPEPKKQATVIKTLLDKAASLFEIRIITITCPTELEINLDPVQFEQLLINLIKNAHEAMSDPQGQIFINCELHNNKLILTIEDEGPGINNPDNLFVPFYTTKATGSGTGLVLSRQIIEAHGGDLILANRKQATGCSVTINLPC